MEKYKIKYNEWLSRLSDTDELKSELVGIAGNEEEQRERFESELSFGTAGLRGKLGAGSSRMNRLTVGKATQGAADYIASCGDEARDKGVVIAHDPRHFSKEFSELAAGIFAANGIKVYLFRGIRPTPELAFAVRRLGCFAGVNITASHNPKEYNGYKLYAEDGCQISSEAADRISGYIDKVDIWNGIRVSDCDEMIGKGMISVLGEETDREYLDKVLSVSIHGKDQLALDIPFVYTPLNGCGNVPFRQMLKARGFTDRHIVSEQSEPDPDFTTVGYPNPEDPKAFRLSEEYGRRYGAELLMATDPDADRFAIEVRADDGSYIPLNGNQTGYILVNYILEGLKNAGRLPEKGAIVRSIVTSSLSDIIAESYGVTVFETLTGFKNICGKIPFLHEHGYKYLFGFEESVGYAASEDIRDKDGISAGMLIAEAAAYYRKRGLTLWQVLQGIYARYGYFAEDEPNIVLEGISGAERIKRMMAGLRAAPFTEISGVRVKEYIDYTDGYKDIPRQNAVKYILENGSWFAVRPSGTEPKIKFYFYSKQDSHEEAVRVNGMIRDEVLRAVNAIE